MIRINPRILGSDYDARCTDTDQKHHNGILIHVVGGRHSVDTVR